MAEKRQTYTAEFTHEAVCLVPEQGYGGSEAARNLGLNVSRLRRWMQALTERVHSALPGKGHLSPEQEALPHWRDEVKRRRMEREM